MPQRFFSGAFFCLRLELCPKTNQARARYAAITRVYEEVFTLKQLANEVGQTVRAALESWPRTVRLIVLIAVLVATAAIWTRYHL